jgi:hypothetical protein
MTVRRYKVTIVMCDGSMGEHEGPYEDGFSATTHAMDLFPDAKRISARVVPGLQLAPGVIDGPYRRAAPVAAWAKQALAAVRPLGDYLIGAHP